MIPVDMVDIRENNPHAVGDCFQCCMASILEMEREDVPHFMKIAHETGKSWTWVVNGWLHDLGLWYCELNYQYFPFCYLTHNESYWIGTGTSPRYPTQRHSVVLKNKDLWTFEIAFDPHPSRAGLQNDRIHEIGLLVRKAL